MSKKRKKIDFSKLSKNVNFKDAMEKNEVLYGLVVASQPPEKKNELSFIVEIDGKKTVLLKSEAGYLPKNEPYTNLVGRILSFVVLSCNDETGEIYVSHRKASKILAEPLIDKMKNEGAVVEGIVRRLGPFGAYVTICEGTYGIIKNADATTDLSTAADALKVNQRVNVKYKSSSPSGQIYLQLAEKIEHETVNGTDYEDLEVGQFVFGRIEKILPHGIIVKSSKNTTILTPSSVTEVYIGQHVTVEIKSKGEDSKSPKGAIRIKLD